MVTQQPNNHGFFAAPVAIIASAAAAAGGVFALFSSFLSSIVPPFDDSQQSVAFATFGTAIILLALSLVIRRKLSFAKARTIGLACLVFVSVSVVLFLYFRDHSRTYVYRFPPSSVATATQTLHVRGELHKDGEAYVGDKTIAQAVHELGGPDFVDGRGVLWTAASKLQVIKQLETFYVSLAMTLTFSIFLAGLAVWRL